MGISSMAFVGFKSKCDVLMLIQTAPNQPTLEPTHFHSSAFHSPTAPAPLSSISFHLRSLGSSFFSTPARLSTRSFRTTQVPSHVRISHPIIPTLHHHDSISDPLFTLTKYLSPPPSLPSHISASIIHIPSISPQSMSDFP